VSFASFYKAVARTVDCSPQSAQESLAEDPEKSWSCALSIVNRPRERCTIITVTGVGEETHPTHLIVWLLKPALEGSTFSPG